MKMKIENIFGGRKLLAAMFVAMLAMVCIGGMVAVSDNETEVSAAANTITGTVKLANGTTPAANGTVVSIGSKVTTISGGAGAFTIDDSSSLALTAGLQTVIATDPASGYVGTTVINYVPASGMDNVAVTFKAAAFELLSGTTIKASDILPGKSYMLTSNATINAGEVVTFEKGTTLCIAADTTGLTLTVKGTLNVSDYVGSNATTVTPGIILGGNATVSVSTNGALAHTSAGLNTAGDPDASKTIASGVTTTSVTSQTVDISKIGYNGFNKAGSDVKIDDNFISFDVSANIESGSVKVYGNIASTADVTFKPGTSLTVGNATEGALRTIFNVGGNLTMNKAGLSIENADFAIANTKIVLVVDAPFIADATSILRGPIADTTDDVTGKLQIGGYDSAFTVEAGAIIGIANIEFGTYASSSFSKIMSFDFGRYVDVVGSGNDKSIVVSETFTADLVKGDTLDDGDAYSALRYDDNIQVSGSFVDHKNPDNTSAATDTPGTFKIAGKAYAAGNQATIIVSDMTFGYNTVTTIIGYVVLDEECNLTFESRPTNKFADATLVIDSTSAATKVFVFGNATFSGSTSNTLTLTHAANALTLDVRGFVALKKDVFISGGTPVIMAISYTTDSSATYNYTSFDIAFNGTTVADDNEFNVLSNLNIAEGEYTVAANVSLKAGASRTLTLDDYAMITVITTDLTNVAFSGTTWTDDNNNSVYAGAFLAVGNAPAGSTVQIASGTAAVTKTLKKDVAVKEGVTLSILGGTTATTNDVTLKVDKGVTLTVNGKLNVNSTGAGIATLDIDGKIVIDGGEIETVTTAVSVLDMTATGEITILDGKMTLVDAYNPLATGSTLVINAIGTDGTTNKSYMDMATALDGNNATLRAYGTINVADTVLPTNTKLTIMNKATYNGSIAIDKDTGGTATTGALTVDGVLKGDVTVAKGNVITIGIPTETPLSAGGVITGTVTFDENSVMFSSTKASTAVTLTTVDASGGTKSSITVGGIVSAGKAVFNGMFDFGTFEVSGNGVYVALETGTAKVGTSVTVTNGTLALGSPATTMSADPIAVNGKISVTTTAATTGLLLVFANANMADADVNEWVAKTVFKVEDSLYSTQYGKTESTAKLDLTAPAIQGYKFNGWKDVSGKTIDAGSAVGSFNEAYADVTEITYAVTLGVVTGADYVIDGIAYSSGSIAYLTAGTHTVSLNAKAGYDVSKATISAAAGGKVTVTGSSLTVAGEGIIGATGVTEKAAGMSITDILMIVLVVVVVILAIVIVMRLMRS